MSSADAVTTVGILGSGIMGAGLVEVVARSGRDVVLRSRSRESADAAVEQLSAGLTRQVDKGRLEADERDAIVGRISTTADLADLAGCDLVIESVVEDMAVKKELFAQLDDALEPEALIASNTSTLPIVEMAVVTSRPERVCGIHFFNPAPMMRLVEVVRPLTAADETISTALAFAESCGKDAVEVTDRAGFVVNALLFPYLNSAVRMWEQGTASIEAIDTAMQGGCNFPMGPFALLDLVGLDTSMAILEALHSEFGEPHLVPATSIKRMVAAGHLGRKSGRGFRAY
ncbi:3-hydroxyacyl-CoA dehydrogenase family protein [Ilumatobacter sp.]|uniref:3-hydroxyacyl-CoA dehydrogenase family protein n=1 Tax=Ilumatobacter sp. TaxID=1967498 RepID=UPI003B529E72